MTIILRQNALNRGTMHEDTIMDMLRSRKPMTSVLSWCLLIYILLVSSVDSKRTHTCSVCKDVVREFEKGIEKTAKSNFGGGNTQWEEKSLGSYARSEVRLVEIMEELWKSSDKETHNLLEEHEELIESFWFKVLDKTPDTSFFTWLCLENIKACCPNNTWGPSCKACPGLVDNKPCSGTGDCDGEGTREGTGECRCQAGYQGDLCSDCQEGWFEESSNNSLKVCRACHISCKSSCRDGTAKGCDECKTGWLPSEEHGCQDIDECRTGEAQCEEDKYCSNTLGSFSCFTCDVACNGCTGSGSGSCKACNAGFTGDGKSCSDMDECAGGDQCTGQNEKCVNEPGTFRCDCEEGFIRQEGACIPKPREPEKKETPKETIQEEEEEDEDDDDDEVDETNNKIDNLLNTIKTEL